MQGTWDLVALPLLASSWGTWRGQKPLVTLSSDHKHSQSPQSQGQADNGDGVGAWEQVSQCHTLGDIAL